MTATMTTMTPMSTTTTMTTPPPGGAAGSATVSAPSMSYNSSIGAGNSVEIGFSGSWASSNPPPTSFTVNNSQCTTG